MTVNYSFLENFDGEAPATPANTLSGTNIIASYHDYKGDVGSDYYYIKFAPVQPDSTSLSGTFELKQETTCYVAVIGGGGSGSAGAAGGGGGGGGGVSIYHKYNFPKGSYSIKVGKGGASVTNGNGTDGEASSFILSDGSINIGASEGKGGNGIIGGTSGKGLIFKNGIIKSVGGYSPSAKATGTDDTANAASGGAGAGGSSAYPTTTGTGSDGGARINEPLGNELPDVIGGAGGGGYGATKGGKSGYVSFTEVGAGAYGSTAATAGTRAGGSADNYGGGGNGGGGGSASSASGAGSYGSVTIFFKKAFINPAGASTIETTVVTTDKDKDKDKDDKKDKPVINLISATPYRYEDNEHHEDHSSDKREDIKSLFITNDMSVGSMIFVVIFFILLALWFITGFIAFIMSVICFGYNSEPGYAIIGLLLAFLFGPLYWIYYAYHLR